MYVIPSHYNRQHPQLRNLYRYKPQAGKIAVGLFLQIRPKFSDQKPIFQRASKSKRLLFLRFIIPFCYTSKIPPNTTICKLLLLKYVIYRYVLLHLSIYPIAYIQPITYTSFVSCIYKFANLYTLFRSLSTIYSIQVHQLVYTCQPTCILTKWHKIMTKWQAFL